MPANPIAQYPASGAMQLIARQTVAGTPTSVTFGNIPQGFKNLLLVGNFTLVGGSNIAMNYNGDSTAGHYNWGLIYQAQAAAGASSASGDSDSKMLVGGAFGSVSITIANYKGTGVNATGDFASFNIGSAATSGGGNGFWNGTGVTSISLADAGGTATFTTGDSFSLYGLS